MARAERITLQEASELSGVSIPTIYRRIRNGELRGAICIDASGKHWELFKSDLPKLTLKRKKRSTEALPAVQVTNEPNPEKDDNVALIAETEDISVSSSGEQDLLIKNAVLTERCADLENKLKQLREELDSAKDDASYWRGRWEQISINFDALRKMLEDKNNDDQELIWDLRGQVADLQDRLDGDYVEDNGEYVSDSSSEEEQVEAKTQAEAERSYPTASYPFVTSEMEAEPESVGSIPRVTTELLYDFNPTKIDNRVNLPIENDPDGEIYPEPDFGDVSSSSLTSADDINPIATYVAEQSEPVLVNSVPEQATSEKENSPSAEIHEQVEEEVEVQEHSSSKLSSFPTARNIKFSMRHSKGRQGKRGRKRIPPLR